MSWSSFQLVPDDVLFFRDGKPSTRGTDHYLRSLFPPHPSTLYGALRTRRLSDRQVDLAGLNRNTWAQRVGDLAAEVGDWGGFGSLELRGPWLVRGGEPLLPAPHDLGLLFGPPSSPGERAPIATVVRFLPDLSAGRRWSHPLALLKPFQWTGSGWSAWDPGTAGVEPASAAGWFLTPAGLAAWRAGRAPEPERFVHASDLWTDEARTGVGLQASTRSGEAGLLYTFGFIRLASSVALGFEVRGSGLKAEGRVRLGGENRTALLEAGPAFPETPLEMDGDLVAVTLAAPSISGSGAYPPGFSAEDLKGTLHGERFRLVAAAVSGFVPIGGWDLANGRAKPLRRAIPAGSVFYFKPVNGAAAGVARALHGKPITDTQDALDKQGFGLALAGVCAGG